MCLQERIEKGVCGIFESPVVLLSPPKCILLSEMHIVSMTVSILILFVFQSKEIGLQMHEELLKVTNELYTVSMGSWLSCCVQCRSTAV